MKQQYKKLQKGFTLIELVIALAIISLFAAAIVFSFDASKSKANVLFTTITEYANALNRLKVDLPCYPKRMDTLFDVEKTATGDMYCGIDSKGQWKGPYAKDVAVIPDSGKIMLNQISPGLTLEIKQGTQNPASSLTPWSINTSNNLPIEIVNEVLVACNGTVTGQSIPNLKGKCTKLDNSAALAGISYVFDQTR